MISYQSLEQIDKGRLYKTFIDAFSDYQVKIDLPFWKFEQMLQRRGYHSEISIGAFENDRLVGFVLNGFRKWNGRATAYDLGTGVIPEFRRKGITSEMLLHVKKRFKGKRLEQYLLEVIKSNTSAVQLYKKQGFKVQREFSCFEIERDKYFPQSTYNTEHVGRIELDQLKEFWDFKPSWQNSIESVNAIPEAFIYSVVRVNNNIVGYGIIDKKTGDIPQLAVNKDYRGNGIARSIISDMIKSTESNKICILNVDTQFKSAEDFFKQLGFEYSVGQYEMLLGL
ncbi:GNAT family N-acetyltransferase [Anaerovorax sp. IOR16]|uniref:GNAT family N-acetyltransferase n=1 Tax=Anaerovorax sp. IOR16 TaxID=2773458 RepID=UPI0019D0526A|nr:GNAT family N-acetyltransferase [Anaerovorax sp. IOR16]